jgi:hypothetical protein
MSETVKPVYITVRRPMGDDPGRVELGHYIFVDGVVTLTDEAGTPLRRGVDQKLTTRRLKGEKEAPLWSAPVAEGLDDRAIAGKLLHMKFSSQRSGSDFNRPIVFNNAGIV